MFDELYQKVDLLICLYCLDAPPPPYHCYSSLHKFDRIRSIAPWFMLAGPVAVPLLGMLFGRRAKQESPAAAKGGVFAERGAFDNDRDAEESYARADRITWLKPGALAAGFSQVMRSARA